LDAGKSRYRTPPDQHDASSERAFTLTTPVTVQFLQFAPISGVTWDSAMKSQGRSALKGGYAGHKALSEVERYTRAADQSRLAEAAIHKLPGASRLGQQRRKWMQ